LFALSPVATTYKEEAEIEVEFKNLYDNVQAKQFRVFTTTPVFSDLQNGEIVIVSSGVFNVLIFKAGEDIYRVNSSCITVVR
jgi:hypothetical protein